MKTALLATVALFVSLSASAGILYGTVQVGPYFNCAVLNNTPYNVVVTGIQYDYTCGDTLGQTFRYSPYVSCALNCGLPSMLSNVYSGPSTFNCNVLAASCFVSTAP